jgi:hypothetical protein
LNSLPVELVQVSASAYHVPAVSTWPEEKKPELRQNPHVTTPLAVYDRAIARLLPSAPTVRICVTVVPL